MKRFLQVLFMTGILLWGIPVFASELAPTEDFKMVCPQCVVEEKESRIECRGFGTSTLLGFSSYYDEKGIYHSHDPNKGSYPLRCTNGHNLWLIELPRCPAGDYGMKELVLSKESI